MNWSDRMKRAFLTFKRMALPLYAWYLILSISGVILAVLSLIPMIISLARSGMLNSEFPGLPAMPNLPGLPFSGSYPNPNPPVPPGSDLIPGSDAIMDGITPYLSLAPRFFLTFIALIILGWLLSSAFMTGMFHLTRKAYMTRARFKDFRLSGFSRVLGWYGILTLFVVILLGLGLFIAMTLSDIDYAVPVFAVSCVFILIAVAIFLAPWLSTSAFYMLNHQELSFGKAFRASWRFYKRHLGSFWAYILTVIGITIIISIIGRSYPNIEFIVSLLVSPFTTILPIVWVLTHEEDENRLEASGTPFEQQALTPLMTSDLGEAQAQDVQLHENKTQTTASEESTSQAIAPNPSPYSPSSYSSQPSPQLPLQELQESPKDEYRHTPQITPEEDSEIYYCPTCGKNARSGASYCSQCGTKL